MILTSGLHQQGFDHNVKLEEPMFDYHVKYEHNMWDYIYFHLYLERIDINDQSAIESYVHRKVSKIKALYSYTYTCIYIRDQLIPVCRFPADS